MWGDYNVDKDGLYDMSLLGRVRYLLSVIWVNRSSQYERCTYNVDMLTTWGPCGRNGRDKFSFRMVLS